MATLPVYPLPDFADNDSSLTNLQNLAYAVRFWTNNDLRPTWHTYKTSAQAIPATTWTSPQFGAVAFDSDSVHSNPGVVINTAGVYAVETCVQTGGSGIGLMVSFLATAGANNPNHTSGSTVRFGLRGGLMPSSGADGALCSTAIVPWSLYPGDSIQPQVYASSAVTLDNNSNSTYENGRFVCNFTGLMIANAQGAVITPPPTFPPMGATVRNKDYTGVNYLQAANQYDGYIGEPVALAVQKLYLTPGQWWTSLPAVMTQLAGTGCRYLIDAKPGGSSAALSTSEQTNLRNLIQMLQGANIDFDLSFWTEGNLAHNNPPFTSATVFQNYWNYYAPIARSKGVRLVYTPGAFNSTTAVSYYPGDTYVDAVAPDFYAMDYVNSGTTLNAIEALADGHSGGPVPFGLAEWGMGHGTAPLSKPNFETYTTYLGNFMAARKLAGKPNYSVIYYNPNLVSDQYNTVEGTGDIKVPGIQYVHSQVI